MIDAKVGYASIQYDKEDIIVYGDSRLVKRLVAHVNTLPGGKAANIRAATAKRLLKDVRTRTGITRGVRGLEWGGIYHIDKARTIIPRVFKSLPVPRPTKLKPIPRKAKAKSRGCC